MKRFILVFLSVVALSASAGAAGKELKVIFWNIQNGMWAGQEDNYDSFVYNLVQYIGELGEEVMVKRNDEITLEEIEKIIK